MRFQSRPLSPEGESDVDGMETVLVVGSNVVVVVVVVGGWVEEVVVVGPTEAGGFDVEGAVPVSLQVASTPADNAIATMARDRRTIIESPVSLASSPLWSSHQLRSMDSRKSGWTDPVRYHLGRDNSPLLGRCGA
jgi:hypothetical protein